MAAAFAALASRCHPGLRRRPQGVVATTKAAAANRGPRLDQPRQARRVGQRGIDAWSPNFRFTFIGVDTDSGVSEQPVGLDETLLGGVRRR